VVKHHYTTTTGKQKTEYHLECPLCRDKKGRKNQTYFYGTKITAVKHWNDMVIRNKSETIELVWPTWLKKKLNRYK
jgi:hypothetical protein